MDREQEEEVLRLTAQYVEEVQAGHQPGIGDYIARYPQYADAIASFIAYYQTIELPLSQTTNDIDSLNSRDDLNEFADDFHIAIESAWQRVMVPETPLQSLFLAAKQQQLSPSQLAAHLIISEDILLLLEQHAVLPESIPQEICTRLARILHQPLRAVRGYLGMERLQQVAEHPVIYDAGEVWNAGKIENTGDAPRPSRRVSFREIIDRSEKLAPEHQKFWREVLAQEQL